MATVLKFYPLKPMNRRKAINKGRFKFKTYTVVQAPTSGKHLEKPALVIAIKSITVLWLDLGYVTFCTQCGSN